MKRILSLLISILIASNCFILCAIASGSEDFEDAVTDTENVNSLEINAESAVLMDAETGTVLFTKNAAEPLPPASV